MALHSVAIADKRLPLRSRIILIGVVVCLGALLAMTSVVFARVGGPAQQVARIARTTGYGAPGPGSTLIVPTGGAGGSDVENGPGSSGMKSTLPFTGLDLLVVGAMGAGLLGLGFGLRRSARHAATSG